MPRSRIGRYDGAVLPTASSRRRRFGTNFIALVLATTAATGSTAPAASTAQLDQIYRKHNIQHELPVVPEEQPSERQSGFRIPLIVAWFLLAGAGVAAVGLALWVMVFDVDRVAARRRKRQRQSVATGAVEDGKAGFVLDWLNDADDLARQGRFAEAIHILLLGVLDTFRTGRDRWNAATAREIARGHDGPNVERLKALVHASEIVHFGGRQGTSEQYRRCRLDAVEFDPANATAVS